MLTHLSIRDFVLIERLDLALGPGLCVLTGETGAGKSIMLDALGMALGERADRSMIRTGAERCVVTATFDLPGGPALRALLEEKGLAVEDELVLRRSLGADGRSRAFVNDQPVGVALLRQVADLLVEVHGQNDRLHLLDPVKQREMLDEHGGHQALAGEVRAAHRALSEARAVEREQAAALERDAADRAYLEHVAGELDELAPQAGEEAELVEARLRLMSREKLAAAIDDALQRLTGDGGVEARLGAALRTIERVLADAGDLLEAAAAALERTRLEAADALDHLERARQEIAGPGDLEQIEERLFALRAAARKHRVEVEALPGLLAQIRDRLGQLDHGARRLDEARRGSAAAWTTFSAAVGRLSMARARAAADLERALNAELPALRLERARIEVRCHALAEEAWGAGGGERVSFLVATNPGAPPGPLDKVASGGELARLMLALKVILARSGSRPCLIFDEVDTGIGGATADAVGERLARLGHDLQVLVVTHAPQVAARADRHLRIAKHAGRRRTAVEVVDLGDDARREEIARMLAGATVTEAARAAATSLIERSA
ncbi:MAG TPA: DNA repair protein RecN [Geminicoccaceae bacterium]